MPIPFEGVPNLNESIGDDDEYGDEDDFSSLEEP
jgi:hypothetical protein